MSSIDDLKSLVSSKGGIARPHLYKVELPSITGSSLTASDLNILAKDVNLPGRQIVSLDKTIGAVTSKIAYGQLSDDVTMTFHVLSDYGVREYFEAWQSLAFNKDTLEVGYKNDYVKDVTITQYKMSPTVTATVTVDGDGVEGDIGIGGTETATYKCKLINAYPTTMNAIQLTNELDGLIELNIQLSYDRWTSEFL